MTTAIHPEVRIGHVHLTVSNLERAVKFYRDALGFEITQRYDTSAVFLSAGGYHHHIGLNTWAGEGASPPPPGRTGLYHFAILYPTRLELARAFKRLFDHGVAIEGASDHGVSEAFYLDDPEGNGIEVYNDRPAERWTWADGLVVMKTNQLDIEAILDEVDRTTATYPAAPEGLRIGHVHLRVGSVAVGKARFVMDVSCCSSMNSSK